MPDFTIEIKAQCKSASYCEAHVGGYEQVLGGERWWPTCTCPAYQFFRNGKTRFGWRTVPNPCKHIKQAEAERCGWHQMFSDEEQTQEGICPKCGGPTEYVRVAV